MSTQESLKKAEAFVAQHLLECVTELRAWQDTAILPNGKLRELGALCRPIADSHYLTVAASLVSRAALDALQANYHGASNYAAPQPSAPLIDAARQVVREALDAVEVRPGDENDDELRARSLAGSMATLRAALATPFVSPWPTFKPIEEAPSDTPLLLRYHFNVGYAIGHKSGDEWISLEGTNWGNGAARFAGWAHLPPNEAQGAPANRVEE